LSDPFESDENPEAMVEPRDVASAARSCLVILTLATLIGLITCAYLTAGWIF
jgi:hypothetical protein